MEIHALSDRLSESPQAFPDCCLAISSTLITGLALLLPPEPGFTVSVGSGSGLLEALIAHRYPNTSVRGVEVNSSVNRYIAEQDMTIVSGTWDLYSGIAQAEAWIFVYPREPKLVAKYIDHYGDQGVKLILWLGPRADWAEYEPCFLGSPFSDVTVANDIGLAPYEMLAIVRTPAQ